MKLVLKYKNWIVRHIILIRTLCKKRTNSAKQRASSGNNRKKKNNSGIFGKIFGIFGKK